MAAAIGVGAAIVTLLPRVTVDVGEPIDTSDAYTAPITISNTNVIPLERVSLALGMCELKIAPQITIKGTNNENCSHGNGARIQPDTWKNHRLGIDDKWRILMQDAINGRNTNMIFSGGDITFVVSYVPWPWAGLHIDRVFGLVTLGSIIGARCAIKPKGRDSWLIVPNLWGSIVGDPSAKKSPGLGRSLETAGSFDRQAASRKPGWIAGVARRIGWPDCDVG